MLRFANAKAADLDTINALIATAIRTWPVSARLKRLAALPLRYNWADFQDFEMVFDHKRLATCEFKVLDVFKILF